MKFQVGRVTVAVSLVALGLAYLADNLAGTGYGPLLLRLWPAALIGIGVEYLVRSALPANAGISHRFDVGGVILLLLVVGLLHGWGFAQNWEKAAWEFGNWRGPAWGVGAEQTVERTADLEVNPRATLAVRTAVGAITVTGDSPDDKVHVKATFTVRAPSAEEARRLVENVRLDATGGASPRVEVELPNLQFSGRGFSSGPTRLLVQVPPGVAVEVTANAGTVEVNGLRGDARVTTNAGAVRVRSVDGNVDIRSDVGALEVEDVTGTVAARTGPGSIRVARFRGGVVESAFGSVRVDDWREELRVVSQTGSVVARTGVPADRDIDIRTNVGSIELEVPAASSLDVFAQTNVGSISSPPGIAVARRNGPGAEARGMLGSGQGRANLRSDTGRITIVAR